MSTFYNCVTLTVQYTEDSIIFPCYSLLLVVLVNQLVSFGQHVCINEARVILPRYLVLNQVS